MERADFYNITIGKLLELNDITKLVVNDIVFFPETRLSELSVPQLKCLFGSDNIEDIINSYESNNRLWPGEIRWDIKRRLIDWYVRNGGCVMHINDFNVWVFTYDGVVRIERKKFDVCVNAIKAYGV